MTTGDLVVDIILPRVLCVIPLVMLLYFLLFSYRDSRFKEGKHDKWHTFIPLIPRVVNDRTYFLKPLQRKGTQHMDWCGLDTDIWWTWEYREPSSNLNRYTKNKPEEKIRYIKDGIVHEIEKDKVYIIKKD